MHKITTLTGKVSKLQRVRTIGLKTGETKRIWEFLIERGDGTELMADVWSDTIEGWDFQENAKFIFYGEYDGGVLHVKRLHRNKPKEKKAVELQIKIERPNEKLEWAMDVLGGVEVTKLLRERGLSATTKGFSQERYAAVLEELYRKATEVEQNGDPEWFLKNGTTRERVQQGAREDFQGANRASAGGDNEEAPDELQVRLLDLQTKG